MRGGLNFGDEIFGLVISQRDIIGYAKKRTIVAVVFGVVDTEG